MTEKPSGPSYSKKRVQKAGVTALDQSASFSDAASAIDILNDWRAAHAVHLRWIGQNLRNIALKVDPNSTVARRLKRMRSVIHKLERYPTMSAARIQDYGGVRAIMKSVDDVNMVAHKMRTSRQRHKMVRETNYIESPDTDGYRGIHQIFSFESDNYPSHLGLFVEAQIRTDIQHAWATAVETMGYVARQPLKSDMGDPELLEFFRELSSEFALREGCPQVPGTIEDRAARVARIRELEAKHSIESRLSVYALINSGRERYMAGAQHALLAIDGDTLRITRFKSLEEAEDAYADAEKDSSIDVVLVSADDMESLERAYPNYFADTETFRGLLDEIIDPVRSPSA